MYTFGMNFLKIINLVSCFYVCLAFGFIFLILFSFFNLFLTGEFLATDSLIDKLQGQVFEYFLLGAPVAGIVFIATTPSLNEEVKRWKKYSGITLAVLIAPVVLEMLRADPANGDDWAQSLYLIPLFLIGIPVLFVCFITLFVKEQRARKSR